MFILKSSSGQLDVSSKLTIVSLLYLAMALHT